MEKLTPADWPRPYDYESGNEKFLFVSYSHRDAEALRNDIDGLLDAGVRIWFDRGIHQGDDWLKRVKDCVRHPDCAGACFYISERSIGSEQILSEIKLVLEEKEKREFHLVSVNIGDRNVFDYLWNGLGELPLKQRGDFFARYLTAFPPNVKYFPRAEEEDDESHLPELIARFESWNARDPEVPYAELERFQCAPFGDGVKIIGYNGYAPNLKIPAVLDGKRVYMLGMQAFARNEQLRKVTIGEGVEILEEGCFRACENLEHVALPVSVRAVGYEAFRSCRSLREITFQKNVRTVGDYCFYLCKKLRSVTFVPGGEGVEIGFNCFQECDELTEVALPEHASKLGMYCFNKCERLGALRMPGRIDEMAAIVVHNCPSIRRLEFPRPLPAGYDGPVIKHCRRLETMVCADAQLPAAAAAALSECGARLVVRLRAPEVALDEATMTLSFAPVQHATGYSAEFTYDSGRRRIQIDEVAFTTDAAGRKARCLAHLTARSDAEDRFSLGFGPEPADDYPSFTVTLRARGDGLAYADSEASATIVYRNRDRDFIADRDHPETLERYIGSEADVTVPARFRHIGDSAFAFSDTLEIIRFPAALDTVGRRAFFHCKQLRRIDWADSLPVTIREEAFAYCFALVELKLPYSVAHIGASAFEVCSGVAEADLSETGVTRIEEKTFRRCIALKTVRYPRNLNMIGDQAFRGCTALIPGDLPERLTRIGASAFSFLMDAAEIRLPATLREVASDFLYYSTGVARITIDERCRNFTVRDNTLLRVRDTADGPVNAVTYPIDGPDLSYAVPARTERICRYAYRDLEHTEEVVIGDDVCEIEEENFSCCWNLRRVVIGKNVRRIGDNCFSHNISLREIVIEGETLPATGAHCFIRNAADFRIVFGGEIYAGGQDGGVWKKLCAEADAREAAAAADPGPEDTTR